MWHAPSVQPSLAFRIRVALSYGAVVKLLSKRWWRPEGQKLELEGAESRGGVPDCRPGVVEHSRYSVWLLWHLSSA